MSELDRIIEENFECFKTATKDAKGGLDDAIKFLIGQVIKSTKAKISPKLIERKIMEKLEAQKEAIE